MFEFVIFDISVRIQNMIPLSMVPWCAEYFELKETERASEAMPLWLSPILLCPTFFFPKEHHRN
jgi:hypothetical protein